MGSKRTIRIFISYAQKGPEWGIRETDEILRKFRDFRSDFPCEIHYFWDDFLEAGRRFTKRIKKELRQADIVLLLITRKFFSSPYINQYEKPIIQKLHNSGKSVIPIIIGDTNYKREWVYKLGVKTLPKGIEHIIFNSRQRDTLWSLVEEGLEEAIRKTYARILEEPEDASPEESKRVLIEQVGCIFIFLAVAVSSYFLYSSIPAQEDVSDRNKPGVDVIDNPPTEYGPETSRVDSTAQDRTQNRTQERSDIFTPPKTLPQIRETTVREIDPSIQDLVSYYEFNGVQPVPRTLGKFGYFGAQAYGQYESCQAINRNGYKPCKKNRHWYLVNEKKNIHHLISFPEPIHKDIYAIRPYYDDFAEVYFHDGENMYLRFCIDLEDNPAACQAFFVD